MSSTQNTLMARWIGAEGRAFERVGRAFQLLGFRPPRPATAGGEGAYLANIAEQYRADLSQQDVAAIVRWALSHSLSELTYLQPGDVSLTSIRRGADES